MWTVFSTYCKQQKGDTKIARMPMPPPPPSPAESLFGLAPREDSPVGVGSGGTKSKKNTVAIGADKEKEKEKDRQLKISKKLMAKDSLAALLNDFGVCPLHCRHDIQICRYLHLKFINT